MAEKTIPVWLHQTDSDKVQIGVAAESENGVQAIDIWSQFDGYELKDVTIGDSPTRLSERPYKKVDSEEPKAQEVVESAPGEENPQPAEGALAEPKASAFRRDFNQS